jgi:hypothetical protein
MQASVDDDEDLSVGYLDNDEGMDEDCADDNILNSNEVSIERHDNSPKQPSQFTISTSQSPDIRNN